MQQSTSRHQLLQLFNLFPVLVFSCRLSAICPVISAFAMSLIIFVLSSVPPVSICMVISPLPMLLIILVLSDIVVSLRVDTAVGVRNRIKEQSETSGCADSWAQGMQSTSFYFVRNRVRLS